MTYSQSSDNSNDLTFLIPAAGFGRRVGSPLAKELLPHPKTQRPMIAECLARCPQGKRHVITRPEKTNLIEFLHLHHPDVNIQLIENSKEWPETLLLSQPHWTARNVVLLPDTDFMPLNALPELASSLVQSAVGFATFEVNDPSVWGLVDFNNEGFAIAEKPRQAPHGAKAWGLLGFQASVGVKLLSYLLESTQNHQWKTFDFSFAQVNLESFCDWTRS